MEFEHNNLVQFSRKFAISINFVTGAFLSFCYIEFLNVVRIDYFANYFLNVVLSIFLYSIFHVVMYFRIYLFVSKSYEEKTKDLAYLHAWPYAIIFSIGIVGFVKFKSGI